jgi:hypothetical protein
MKVPHTVRSVGLIVFQIHRNQHCLDKTSCVSDMQSLQNLIGDGFDKSC